ncbi:hypothetical protein G7Z17_g1800 [Cylindrodendrum hubeiense]|uniref:Heterokaryon incompatibility domain-containing protein n=1 Tax=Cylindrodendrum hubeiense TaxID=595255 RepID=A0A9P5HK11_9HYPO|nr:hypothetical protein G7Z17_g1800 [Cylindrodendrum hubeiense]
MKRGRAVASSLSRLCQKKAASTLASRSRATSSRFHRTHPHRPIRAFSTPSKAEENSGIRFDSYPYGALPPGPSFRLLDLHPRNHAQGGDQILASLRDSPLDTTTEPYEALSYNWDDPYAPNLLPPNVPRVTDENGKASCAIIIDGRYNVQVTPNLMLALRALQLRNATRTIWVDALCINQSSPQEKSSQVPLMTDIYSKARKVVIWLGEEDYWTSGSVSVINRWSRIYVSALKTGARQPEILEKLKEWRTFEVEEQACFEALVRRAWFTRAWTFQEICLADEAEIRCGKYTIPWVVFGNACATVIAAGQENFVFEEHENVKTLFDFYNLCRDMPERDDRARDERFQLSRLLQRARPQQATDPRDKLYSLLGIANPPRRAKGAYHVDYTENPKEVYRRFTREMIVEDGDLGVLSSVQRKQSPTKELEYYVRTLALEDTQKEVQEAEARGEDAPVPTATNDEFERDQLLVWRDAQRNIFPHLFSQIELQSSESAVNSLPSWVPDFATQDHVEYVARDPDIRRGLPENLIRTRFPRPIAQQFNDGWPRYWLNKQFSYRIESGDITYETGNPDHLGVWGVKVGTVKSVFEMPFTSDPTVRVSLRHSELDPEPDAPVDPDVRRPRAPPAPVPFNFDFTRRFWPVQNHESSKQEPVLTEDLFYKHTGERTQLALLRTLTADMLPISDRLPQAQKTVLFPFHYDWYFWNQGPNNKPRKFPNMLPSRLESWSMELQNDRHMPVQAWDLLTQTFRVWRARFALWMRGGTSNAPWTEFDANELQHAWRIKKLYLGFLIWPWDTVLFASMPDSWRRNSGSSLGWFGRHPFLAMVPLCILEGIFKFHWKHDWAPGTILEGVPTAWVWLAISLVVWFGIKRGARRVRGFERDVSMPVGWENGAARVVVNSDFNWIPDFSQTELEGLQGLWGISCEIQNAVNRASWNREFFVTENGYMGIGPVGVRPGDEVWNLIGGHVPFILRLSSQNRCDGGDRCYRLVGESYVHGIMDGELWTGQRDAWSDLEKMKAKATKVVLV